MKVRRARVGHASGRWERSALFAAGSASLLLLVAFIREVIGRGRIEAPAAGRRSGSASHRVLVGSASGRLDELAILASPTDSLAEPLAQEGYVGNDEAMTLQGRRRRPRIALALFGVSVAALIALPAAWFLSRPDVSVGELPSLEEPAMQVAPASDSPVLSPAPEQPPRASASALEPAAGSVARARAAFDTALSQLPLPPVLSGIESVASAASPIKTIPVSSAFAGDLLGGDRRVPVSLAIPAIEHRSSVDATGVDARTRELAVPESAEGVVWYQHGPSPGASGSAVLAGHVDYNGVAGAFYRLRELEPGDRIAVSFDDGSRQRFEVVARRRYKRDELPTDRVFASGGRPVLTLITCGGRFDESERRYAANVVVFAVPLEAV